MQSRKRKAPMDSATNNGERATEPTNGVDCAEQPCAHIDEVCDSVYQKLHTEARTHSLTDEMAPYPFYVAPYCAWTEVSIADACAVPQLLCADNAALHQLLYFVQERVLEYSRSLWLRVNGAFIFDYMRPLNVAQRRALFVAAALHKRNGAQWRSVAQHFVHCERHCAAIDDAALSYINCIHEAWAGKFGVGVPRIMPSEALVECKFTERFDIGEPTNVCLEFAHDAPFPRCATLQEWLASWNPCVVRTSELQPWHYILYASIPEKRARVIATAVCMPLCKCRTSQQLYADIEVMLLRAVYAQYCFFVNETPYIVSSCTDRIHLSRAVLAEAAMRGSRLCEDDFLDRYLQQALDPMKSANTICVQLRCVSSFP
jgi:hypothetical protein